MVLNTQNPIQQFLDESGVSAYSLDSSGNITTFGGLCPDAGIAGGTGLHLFKKTITSAQLLALRAAPITIIAAPGAGCLLQVNAVSLYYKFGATAYTLNAGTLKLFYGPVANAKALCASQAAGSIDQITNRTIPFVALLNPGALTDAQGLNVPIQLGNDGVAEFSLGDGTLDIVIAYSMVAS